MKKFILTIVLATLCLFFRAEAQSDSSTIKPLNIGDTIPEALWQMPLQVVNHPEGKKTITLNDYKGKLIILDFWGRYCAPCIKFLPKLDSLGQAFDGKVQVLPLSDFNNSDELTRALDRFIVLKEFKCPISLLNKQLLTYFPHKLVSHVVWIDKQGIVCGITESDYVDKLNVIKILTGKRNILPVKTDIIGFNYKQPLLTFNHANIAEPKKIYFSAFTGSIEGISPPSGTVLDSTSQSSITSFYNMGLLALCQLALEYRTDAQDTEFILKVFDQCRYIKNSATYREWSKANTFCYTIRLPITTMANDIEQIVKEDLKRWLKVLGINVSKTSSGKFVIVENGYQL